MLVAFKEPLMKDLSKRYHLRSRCIKPRKRGGSFAEAKRFPPKRGRSVKCGRRFAEEDTPHRGRDEANKDCAAFPDSGYDSTRKTDERCHHKDGHPLAISDSLGGGKKERMTGQQSNQLWHMLIARGRATARSRPGPGRRVRRYRCRSVLDDIGAARLATT